MPVQDEGDMSLVISPPKGEMLVDVVPRQGRRGDNGVLSCRESVFHSSLDAIRIAPRR